MTVYSYAQLEGLWINAGGSKSLAPIMAAIAEAESGGNSDAHNPSGASGLWQILGNPFPGNAFDPATNARMAVAKYKSQGLGAWTTYTSGAYKAYLSGKTTPDANVPGSPSAQSTASTISGSADCLVPNPLTVSVGPLSLGAGPSCLFSKSNARAFIGAGLIALSVPMASVALALAAVGVAAKAAAPVGGALMLVPGAEGVGAAVAATGRVAKNPAQEGRRQGAQRQRQAKQAAAREDRETMARYRAQGGEPKENPDLEVRAGTVRESTEQRAARRRRETGAARARARRSVSSGQRPASREEAGF